MPDYLKLCEQAARAGGAILLDWKDRFTAHEKGPADMVTEADLASQEAIRRIVLSEFPDHDFLGEETAAEAAQSPTPTPQPPTPSARFRWIVDPLDGTTNYIHHIPEFAVSVALERDGEVLAGTVFNPVSDECFTAGKGAGAWLNGRRLSVSAVADLGRALVAVSFSHRLQPDSPALADFQRVVVACQSVRRTGSSALNLCYLAAGRFDAFWARDTKSWDVAAGWLLVQEAGGIMTDLSGSPFSLSRPRFIAAATEPLHEQLRGLIR